MRTATLLLLALPGALQAQSISTQGFAFNPSVLTVTAGTSITLTIGGQHTMTEVDEATWNANGNTWNGGFNFDGGTHTLTLDIPGTYYYVCMLHASSGMKGRIIVESNTAIQATTGLTGLQVFPNPASSVLNITLSGTGTAQLIDGTGRLVRQRAIQGNDQIPVADLPQGTYLFRVLDTTGRSVDTRLVTIAH